MSDNPQILPSWFHSDLAVIDVETTGLDSQTDRIIEIAIVHMREGQVLDTWNQLVNPEQEIPEEVTKITGITQDDIKDQPIFSAIAEEAHRRLDGRVIVAYNLSFDRGFVRNELQRTGYKWPDTWMS